MRPVALSDVLSWLRSSGLLADGASLPDVDGNLELTGFFFFGWSSSPSSAAGFFFLPSTLMSAAFSPRLVKPYWRGSKPLGNFVLLS